MVTYPAVVEWDDNADAYGVVFPDLSIGAMGDTHEEALVNAESMYTVGSTCNRDPHTPHTLRRKRGS